MAGGTTNTSTVQNDGIDITTNAGAGSINNYSHLVVHGSTTDNSSAAKGSSTSVGVKVSTMPAAMLMNLQATLTIYLITDGTVCDEQQGVPTFMLSAYT